VVYMGVVCLKTRQNTWRVVEVTTDEEAEKNTETRLGRPFGKVDTYCIVLY